MSSQRYAVVLLLSYFFEITVSLSLKVCLHIFWSAFILYTEAAKYFTDCGLLSYFTGAAQAQCLTREGFDDFFFPFFLLSRFQPQMSKNPSLTLTLCEHSQQITMSLLPRSPFLNTHSARRHFSASQHWFFTFDSHSFDALDTKLMLTKVQRCNSTLVTKSSSVSDDRC